MKEKKVSKKVGNQLNKDQDLFLIPKKPNVKISHGEILAIVHIMHFFERNPGVTEVKEDIKALQTLLDRIQTEGF